MELSSAMTNAVKDPRATSRSTRLWIGLQVAGMLVLAITAVSLVTWLSERRGLRVRFDLTAAQQSTLSPETIDILGKLGEPVAVDVFYRPSEGSLQGVVREVQERMNKLLVLARDGAPGKIEITSHAISGGIGAGLARAQDRMRELDLLQIEPGGVVVVSQGERRVPLAVRGDIADLDPGYPGDRSRPALPARIVSFRGEEAFVSAVLKLADGSSPTVVFLTGHGERNVLGTDERGLTRLVRELEIDGFEVQTWSVEGQKPLPERASVVAWIGPEQPLAAGEFEELSRFVESGGALVAAPGTNEIQGGDSLPAFVERYGVRVESRGWIGQGYIGSTGVQIIGDPRCGLIYVSGNGLSAQPITDALRRADRRVLLPFPKSLEVAKPPTGGVVLPLLRTSEDAWRDLPDASERPDWVPNAVEPRGPFVVGIESKFSPPAQAPAGRPTSQAARPESRVICLGSAEAFCNLAFDTNRDLLLSVFNHAAAREFRVNVVKRNVEERRIDIGRGSALATVHWVAVFLIPGACLVLGLFTAWKRRR